ncbi:hypothetical protein GCM10010353_12630 [Streptomyces chryseus]|uniref:Uncharacterized protein n=1 Tax=Streptomyces chryseus TaxID=68186 RepID=A0ABQ3DGI2_9ACTN|nr:hypothetical protein GCM10010353_12630 [Streptomyces chryseus]GHA93011.1 hypothetical protein GCM10010346_14580 [Streptomyces chryseus]
MGEEAEYAGLAPPSRAAPPTVAADEVIILRRESFVRRYSCCSGMLMRRAICSGIPVRGVSAMKKNFPVAPNSGQSCG